MSKHTPSKYQAAVYHFITDGSGNAVVDAVAGSGKSTTIVNALNLIPEDKSVLFLAFNKAIVEELKIKVGMLPNVDVKTLHSLGISSIKEFMRADTNADKYKLFVNISIKNNTISPLMSLEGSDFKEWRQNIIALIDLLRVNLVELGDESAALDIAAKHGLYLQDNEITVAFKAISWGLNNESSIDFTDMLYFPIMKNIRMPKYDFVFIDECQDLNAAQRELFLRCLKPDGRFIAVGDPRQAIYGFAGADVKSFNILKNLPDTVSMPLSVCYRCDRVIIDLAKTLVPQIECRENAATGTVNKEDSIGNVRDGDMILCRLTAPLVEVCMQYISNGVKAFVKGRDIGANLVNMIKNTNREQMVDVFDKFDKELAKIQIKCAKDTGCSISEAKEHENYIRYMDKMNAIRFLSQDLHWASDTISRINTIFSDKAQGICLSTIHKSKGLESDRVFILAPETMYHERSMRIDWMAEQEANLVYVAYTRAKHYLGFITDYEIKK